MKPIVVTYKCSLNSDGKIFSESLEMSSELQDSTPLAVHDVGKFTDAQKKEIETAFDSHRELVLAKLKNWHGDAPTNTPNKNGESRPVPPQLDPKKISPAQLNWLNRELETEDGGAFIDKWLKERNLPNDIEHLSSGTAFNLIKEMKAKL